jgi:hypothetical protein
VFGSRGFVELTQLWRSAEAFADLPKSAKDAGLHFGQREGHEAERAFWQQFQASPQPELLNHRMKQLAELLRMARPALQDLCVNLWPTEVLPTSFFGLLARRQEAVPQVDRWKRSACLEGDRRVHARVKAHFRHVEAEVVAVGPPEGKDRVPEQFFAEVEESAWITEAKCPKDTLDF